MSSTEKPNPKTANVDQIIDLTKEFMSLSATLHEESDRGTVLVGAAAMDEGLTRLLRSFFVDSKKIVDQLFEHQGSLGTFSGKIDLAFCCGLIGVQSQRDLHLIRKIRNDFAHSLSAASFDDESISARCNELKSCNWAPPENRSTARQRFFRSIAHLSMVLDSSSLFISRCKVPPDRDQSHGSVAVAMAEKLVDAIDPEELKGKSRIDIYQTLLQPFFEAMKEAIEQKSNASSVDAPESDISKPEKV